MSRRLLFYSHKYSIYLMLFFIFFLFFIPVFAEDIRILASVNDAIITNVDLDNMFHAVKRISNGEINEDEIGEVKEHLLNDRIDEILILEMCSKLEMTLTREEEEFIKSQIKLIDNIDHLDRSVTNIYYDRMKSNIFLSKLVQMEYVIPVSVTHKEIDKYKDDIINDKLDFIDSFKIVSYSFPEEYDLKKVEYTFDRIHNEYEVYNDVSISIPVWVKLDMFPVAIREQVKDLKVAQFTKPLKIDGIYKIFEIQDKESSIVLDSVVTGFEIDKKYKTGMCESEQKIEISLYDVKKRLRNLFFASNQESILTPEQTNYKSNFVICSNNAEAKIEDFLIMKKNADRYDLVMQKLRNKAVINIKNRE